MIVDQYNRIVSLGYNGFPRGVADREHLLSDRDEKYKRVVHAETNAILFAERSCLGCTLYTWPFMPCARCASIIIQAGLVRVCAPRLTEQDPLHQRWAAELATSKDMFLEVGVEIALM